MTCSTEWLCIIVGNILYKDLFGSFPYRNTIDMIELSGADFKRSLEVTHGFLQMQGRTVTITYIHVHRLSLKTIYLRHRAAQELAKRSKKQTGCIIVVFKWIWLVFVCFEFVLCSFFACRFFFCVRFGWWYLDSFEVAWVWVILSLWV